MDFFFNTLKKLLTFGLALAMVTVFVYVPQQYGEVETVPEAEALIPGVPELVFDPANVANTAQTLANSLSLIAKEFTLDGIAFLMAQAVISNLVADTITWINSGFRGSPAFVQDLDRYLLNVADEAAGAFITSLGPDNPLSFLCSPFALDIQVALALEYEQARVNRPYRGCRISDFTGDFEQFIDGNFNEGSWDSWFRIVAQPEIYTPIGALSATERALERTLQRQQGAESQTVANNRGFMSLRVCDDAVSAPAGTSASTSGSVFPTSNPNAVDAVDDRCRVATPGTTIADRLSASLGLGEQSLVAADEFNELINALLSQLAVQALNGTAGLLGLSQGTGFTYSGFNGGSFVNALQAQGSQSVSQGLAGSQSDIDIILNQQQSLLSSAQSYNQVATALLNQPSQSALDPNERAALEGIVAETDALINELTNERIPALQQNLADYQDIEQQLSSGQLSQSEQTRLRNEQLQIISTVNGAGHYTDQQIATYEQRWESIIDSI